MESIQKNFYEKKGMFYRVSLITAKFCSFISEEMNKKECVKVGIPPFRILFSIIIVSHWTRFNC